MLSDKNNLIADRPAGYVYSFFFLSTDFTCFFPKLIEIKQNQ